MTAVFDVCGALPSGTTVLEASAGTGKTFTIETLATRFVAEGKAALTDLLVIAFGRAAAAELRERVRNRMLATRDALADPGAAASHDAVVRHLADAPADEVARRRDRLTTAVASFDEATITTTHQFCQRTLASLGIGADVDPRETFVEDLTELADEAVADLYVRTFGPDGAPDPKFGLQAARTIATTVVTDVQAFLDVAEPDPGSAAWQQLAFARAVREEVNRRREDRSLVTYDDLVGRLASALSRPEDCERNRAWLRSRYKVVMVDEFQDTDRLQWQILHDAFHGHSDLVLIGDPKQAIFGFRGGDVVTYLIARRHAHHHLTLPDNHRSDARLVAAVSGIFADLPLGDDGIRLTAVTGHHETRLRGPHADDPLRLRLVEWRGRYGGSADSARATIAADVAADIQRLLHDGTELFDDEARAWRPVAPGDIAVLVRRWKDATDIGDQLRALGIRVVTTGESSVFASPAARHWLALLRALDQPNSSALLRAAMITPLLGYTGDQLAADGDRLADEAAARLRGWAEDLRSGGIAALLHALTTEGRFLTTALQRPDGEREVTDLRHVAETLHEQSRHVPGAHALTAWLSARIREADADRREQLQRRVDSDADAVQILTVFGSKGLEFPVVYVPHAWNRWDGRTLDILRYHAGDRRLVDPLGPSGPDWAARTQRHVAEEVGEDLRLLYVAMTRASRQVVLHWAPTKESTRSSALHRVLSARISGDSALQPMYPCKDVTVAALTALGIPATEVPPTPGVRTSPQPPEGTTTTDLAVAPFDRPLDTTWRRTSYTGLTAAAHEASFANETATGDREDEPGVVADGTAAAGPGGVAAAEVSPMADLPKGATFGTTVHHVLEVLDTGGPQPGLALQLACEAALDARPVPGVTAPALSAALVPAVTTPLGDLAGDVALWQIPRRDRLAELEFELPLAPGDETVLLGDVAALVRRHLPAGDALLAYPDRLHRDGLDPQRLRGFLTGSIDAVLRVDGRYLVTDYKTNWLGAGDPLLVQEYEPSALATAMLDAHYPLQALLYGVALHRYLRWRLPGYEPARHLGGVLYLFVRGMAGPAAPRAPGANAPYGVFSWRPPAALVADLSELLDGRTS